MTATSVYVESSALLAWLNGEKNSSIVESAVNSASVVCTSRLTFTECERTLARAEADGLVTPAERMKRMSWLAILEREWDVLEISRRVHVGARRRFFVEPVRTLDAIHLATALEFSAVYEHFVVLSFDQRILKNLAPLGLSGS